MSVSKRSRANSALFLIDKECDQFEIVWRAGQNPQIEDVLARLPVDAHPFAFRELLGIELELRRRRGDDIRREEYERRFASFPSIISELAASFWPEVDETTQADPNETQAGSVTTSTRFRDLRLFRRGGLGTLYRSIDESLHREAVVKFMSEQCEKDPSLVAQFKVEAELTSRLDHPGIVPVYGIGNDWNGRPFYVMRLINGDELKQAIGEYHQSPSRQGLFNLLEHLIGVCNTLAYAHQVGIIHCDIKPANIMIGRYGETFVLDWGLATNFERTSTFLSTNEPTVRAHSDSNGSSSGARGGTYGYISPEQLLPAAPIGPTSDVYSLGATLFEILTNQPPFNGHDPDVREKIRRGQFARPSSLRAGICSDLEAICLKAMSLAPNVRYATAKHLANDLTNWIRDEAIQAAPDRWYNRVARLARRHRGSTAAFFITLLTMVIASGLIIRTLEIAASQKRQQEFNDERKEQTSQAVKQGFTFALDAFEGLCRPLANGEMSNLEVFRPLVKEINNFIESYLDHLEGLENREGLNVHTARVYELRATVTRVIKEDLQTALKDLQLAEQLYINSPTESRERFNRQLQLVQNHLSQGRLYIQLEKLEDARRILESVVDRTKRMSGEQPNNKVLLRFVAEAHHGLGEVFLNRKLGGQARQESLLDAESHFNTSLELRQKLVNESPIDESRNFSRDLARSFGYLGDVYLAKGDIPSASGAFEESKKRREKLYHERTGDPECRFQFARGLGNFGRLERDYRGMLASAIEQLVKAAQLQQELTDDFRDVASFASELGDTQNFLAEIYLFAALEDPMRADEFGALAREAASSASVIHGRLKNQGKSGSGASLAQSLIMLSLLNREKNSGDALRQVQDAKELMLKLGPEQLLSGSELVVLAMARCLAGEPEEALRALESAEKLGENSAYRFDRHQQLAFQSLANDPALGRRLKELVKRVGETLTTE